MVSPWTASGVSATTFAVSTAIWLVVMQWASAGVGGYLAGRLRATWIGIHDDETYFRDTAHGFCVWALSTLIVAGLMSGAVTAVIGGGASAVTSIASGAAQGASQGAAQSAGGPSGGSALPLDYYVDTLFRPSDASAARSPNGGDNIRDTKTEASRILTQSLATGTMPDPDKAQLARLVANATGMSEADARTRLDQVLGQIDQAKTQAKEAADKARKASAMLSLMTFLSLLIGAFIGCVSAAFGGKLRDDYR